MSSSLIGKALNMKIKIVPLILNYLQTPFSSFLKKQKCKYASGYGTGSYNTWGLFFPNKISIQKKTEKVQDNIEIP